MIKNLLTLFILINTSVYGASPVVSNLTASQRAGTKLVDITYDVVADTPTVKITLKVSTDSGETFTVPATKPYNLEGAIGLNIPVGTGKMITWNAGVNWNQQTSNRMRFKVVADDGVVPAANPDMAFIPAGTFQMGDNLDSSPGAPVVTVDVSGFYMGKYEVTKALWDEVSNWGRNTYNGAYELRVGEGKGTDHPVYRISWYDIVKWCNARSEKEGLTPCYSVNGSTYRRGNSDDVQCDWSANGYRLPTEAEWEKAARGGLTGKRFPWGDTINHTNANYRQTYRQSYDVEPYTDNTFHPDYNDGQYPYTSPVGSFAPNGYGLYDMAGNNEEWCWDWYNANTYKNGAADPRGPATGTLRVIQTRGCHNSGTSQMIAPRYRGEPELSGAYLNTNRFYISGFRVARSLAP